MNAKKLAAAEPVAAAEPSLPIIDSVRVYQSVLFNKKQETFFSTRTNLNTKKEGVKIKINNEYRAVEIISERDHIMVPFTNISCIYFRSKVKQEQMEDAKKLKAASVPEGDNLNRPR